MNLDHVKAYELVEKHEISDIKSMSYLLKHKKTGAKIALLENDDENKVFYIGFRTPPKNSTGVAHILEHSVLCGSKDFPIKDPFVELVKGSLNTFLNAMTYPDKTLYPVASCNDKDFQNLMHVYLDAVFYPNIYKNKSIFRQEGWHYELEKPEDDLKINGVVYNEMKGAFSSPDDVLEREMMNSLYPDTEYGVESGGDPKVIPELSYEEFLEFHRTYYHPSNSYIYLYGNMDMEEKLNYIDQEYLSKYDFLEIDSNIHEQKPFDKVRRTVKEYPISEGEDIEENTFISLNYSVADTLDDELYIAMDVLDYALCSAPGAPLKQKLVDLGIGKDVYSICDCGIKQPYFCVVAKGTDLSKEQSFLDTIHSVLEGIVKDGFDEKALLAAINYFEFKYREADFGSYPKGLMYGLQMLDSWLYDDYKPFIHIEANHTYESLKNKVSTGYFENIVKKYLLDNKHCSIVVLQPKVGLLEEEEQQLAKELADRKSKMSEQEIEAVIEEYKALNAFREGEDAKEDLEKIPLLKREDLKREETKLVNEVRKIGDNIFLYHDIYTNGIAYIRLIFDLHDIPEEYFPYISILKGCIGLVNTKNYTYNDLFNEINLSTGGIHFTTNSYTDIQDASNVKLTFELKTKVLTQNIEQAISLMKEMMFHSIFDDDKRLLEILAEGKSRMQANMMSSGHSLAAVRALSYSSLSAAYNEELSGIAFYRFVCDLEEHFEERKHDLIQKLKDICTMIFRKENLCVDLIGDENAALNTTKYVSELIPELFTNEVKKSHYTPELLVKNEGFMNSAQVQYVSRAGNYKKANLEYTGALKVLKVIMGYEYLWVNVRVKGGAYGCMCSFGSSGDSYFVSYRDPNLEKTIEVFENAAEAIAEFDADERTMTQFIIGTVSDLDIPLTPASKGLLSLSAYMSGITDDMRQQWRNQVLDATPEDIRKLSAYLKAFMDCQQLCVVGNSLKIKEQEKLFKKVENLL